MDDVRCQERRDIVGYGQGDRGYEQYLGGGAEREGGPQLLVEEEGSSEESVYYSAGSDSGGNSVDEEESKPVSIRTRSRLGRLLAVVNEASLPRWVLGRVAGTGLHDFPVVKQVQTGEVCEDPHSLECEGVPQCGVAGGHQSL